MTDFVIASANDFDTTEVIQLPSQIGTDKAVKLRKPDIISLLANGDEVPEFLASIALAQANGGMNTEIEITSDNLPGVMQSIDLICKASFVEPRIGTGDNELSLSNVNAEDKMWVMSWVLGGEYEAAKRFPEQPTKNAKPVSKK